MNYPDGCTQTEIDRRMGDDTDARFRGWMDSACAAYVGPDADDGLLDVDSDRAYYEAFVVGDTPERWAASVRRIREDGI